MIVEISPRQNLALIELFKKFQKLYDSSIRFVNSMWGRSIARKETLQHFWLQSRIARELPAELLLDWLGNFYDAYVELIWRYGRQLPGMKFDFDRSLCIVRARFFKPGFLGCDWRWENFSNRNAFISFDRTVKRGFVAVPPSTYRIWYDVGENQGFLFRKSQKQGETDDQIDA